MPAKTRRQRAKLSNQKRKTESGQTRPAAAIRQPESIKQEAPARIAAPQKTVPAPEIKSSVIRYPYITSELWTIGILSAITLVILIVLALVIS